MPGMTTLIVLLAMLQQEETIGRASKAPYQEAVRNCARAVELTKDAPAEAVDILTRIIESPKIKKVECRLRIEIRPGTYSRKYDFFPHRFRGLAHLRQAEKATNRERKSGFLRQAEKDFEESVRRGMNASQTELDQTREKRKAAEKGEPAPTVTDPEPAFRNGWQALLVKLAYPEALRYINQQGAFLSPAKKARYIADTESECREAVNKRTTIFLLNLERTGRMTRPLQISRETFERDFALLPDPIRIVTTPEHEWCESVRQFLADQRAGKERIDALLEEALQGISLGSKGRWFLALESICYRIVEREVQALAAQAGNALSPERNRLQQTARARAGQWNKFGARSQDKLPGVAPRRDFAALLGEFPKDYDGFGAVEEALRKSMSSEDPDRALSAVENILLRIRDGEERLSRESRAEILRYRITVRGLRRFFVGRTVEETVREVSPLGAELKKLEGSFTQDRFGPKIARLFEQLR